MKIYELSLTTYFCAAHRLRGYSGKCERLHGHNWTVSVTVRGSELDSTGMLVDFGNIRKAVKHVLKKMDHSDLNDMEAFENRNPTSENIAVYIFESLSPVFDCDRYRIHRVTVSETPSSTASYERRDND
ncbi:MAG: 6-carboxytetrahydropterin synthase QueD [Kiritimatiellia bacterium]